MEGRSMPTKLAFRPESSSELLAAAVAVGAVLVVLAIPEVVEAMEVVEVAVGEKWAVEHQEAVEYDVVRDVELGGAVPISDGRGIDQGSCALQ